MMNLLVIRHAEAEAHSEDGSDAARALTAAGVTTFENVCRTLAREVRGLAVICHSPRRRAVQTAEILAGHYGLDNAQVDSRLDSGNPLEGHHQLVVELGGMHQGVVALVAHEPEVGALVSSLLGLPRSRVVFDPGMVASIEFLGEPQPGRGLLRWCLPPWVGE